MARRKERRMAPRRRRLLPTQVRIKDRPFWLHDISSDGMGVILDGDETPFEIGERLTSIRFPAPEGSLTLSGVVSHMSTTTTGRLCGIRFLFRDSREFEAVTRFVNAVMVDLMPTPSE